MPGPLPPSGSARSVTRFTEIWDKGKATVIVSETTVTDPEGRLLWTTKRSIFARGEGGLGGERGRQHRSSHRIAHPTSRCRCRPAAAGAAIPALRRPQCAALRSGIRCGGWFSATDPARLVHLRHRMQSDRRHPPRRRREPGSLLRRPVRRRGVPRRDTEGQHLEETPTSCWPSSPRQAATTPPCCPAWSSFWRRSLGGTAASPLRDIPVRGYPGEPAVPRPQCTSEADANLSLDPCVSRTSKGA